MDHFRFSRTLGEVSINVTTLFATTCDSHSRKASFETDVEPSGVEYFTKFLAICAKTPTKSVLGCKQVMSKWIDSERHHKKLAKVVIGH